MAGATFPHGHETLLSGAVIVTLGASERSAMNLKFDFPDLLDFNF
jgi:hypothetical protein